MNAERKLGRFRVTRDYLVNEWRSIQPLFSVMVPVEIAYDWSGGAEITAFSEQFATVPVGELPPLYDAIAERQPDGSVSVKFSKA